MGFDLGRLEALESILQSVTTVVLFQDLLLVHVPISQLIFDLEQGEVLLEENDMFFGCMAASDSLLLQVLAWSRELLLQYIASSVVSSLQSTR